MSYLIRAVQKKDLEDLLKLSRTFPLYNLPSHKGLLKEKLELSKRSFQKKLAPFERNYLFVLEDLKLKQVIGSSQILSFSAKNRSYCYLLKKDQNSTYLNLISRERKRQQIGGLVLSKKYRASNKRLGLQLGLARFLYMKKNKEDFSRLLEVSLTSPFQGKDNPFWRETGAKYLKQDYLQALEFYRKDPDSFLKKLPQELRIDLKSLSKEARLCLETVHPQTLPAYKGLLKRGFKISRHRHLLDGGLYLEIPNSQIFKPIENLELKFTELEKNSKSFLIGPAISKKFLAVRVKGEKKGKLLKIEKNFFFREGEKVLSLPLT